MQVEMNESGSDEIPGDTLDCALGQFKPEDR